MYTTQEYVKYSKVILKKFDEVIRGAQVEQFYRVFCQKRLPVYIYIFNLV